MLQYRLPGGTVVFDIHAIGAGTFGTVYPGKYTPFAPNTAGASSVPAPKAPETHDVAVKFVQCTRSLRVFVAAETDILSQLTAERHRNIIRLLDNAIVDTGHAVTGIQIMERAKHSVQNCIDRAQPLDALQCAIDIARACSFIHARDIVHSDITTMNILQMHDGRFVLSDFGVSCKRGVPRQANAFTNVACRAPECHIDNVADPASDMWSLACVIAELSCSVPIMFHAAALSGALAHKLLLASTFKLSCATDASCSCAESADYVAPDIWTEPAVYCMAAHCLQADPARRCSADCALKLLHASP